MFSGYIQSTKFDIFVGYWWRPFAPESWRPRQLCPSQFCFLAARQYPQCHNFDSTVGAGDFTAGAPPQFCMLEEALHLAPTIFQTSYVRVQRVRPPHRPGFRFFEIRWCSFLKFLVDLSWNAPDELLSNIKCYVRRSFVFLSENHLLFWNYVDENHLQYENQYAIWSVSQERLDQLYSNLVCGYGLFSA